LPQTYKREYFYQQGVLICSAYYALYYTLHYYTTRISLIQTVHNLNEYRANLATLSGSGFMLCQGFATE